MTVWERRQVAAITARVAALVAFGIAATTAIDAAAGGSTPLVRARELAREILLFSGILGAAQWAASVRRHGAWIAHRAAGGHPLRLAPPVALSAALATGGWAGVALAWPAPGDPVGPRAWVEAPPGRGLVGWWDDGRDAEPLGRVLSGGALGASVLRPSGRAEPRASAGDPVVGVGGGVIALGLLLAAGFALSGAPADRSRGRLDGDARALGMGLMLGFGVLGVDLAAQVFQAPPAVVPLTVGAAGAWSWARVGGAPG